MNNLSIFFLTAVLTIASAWPIMKTVSAGKRLDQVTVNRSMNGAYRDGLYLGRLDALAGRPPRAAVGRWSEATDREMFRAGYNSGYGQAIDMAQ